MNIHRIRHLLVLVGGAATLSLVASGCAQKCPTPRHAEQHHHHGARGHHRGCNCDRAGRRGHHRGHGPGKAWAWKKMRMAKHRGSFGAPRMLCPRKLQHKAKWLGLTNDQLTKLKTLAAGKHTAATAMRPKLHAAFKALRDEWQKDKPDAAKLQQLAQAFLALKQKKMQGKLDLLIKVQAVTTPAQWKQIAAGKMRHMGAFGKRGFKHRRGPHPGAMGRRGRRGPHPGAMGRGHRGHHRFAFKMLGAPMMMCPKMLVMHQKWLGLSADQVTQLKALGKTQRSAMVDTRLSFKRARVAMKAEWLKDQPDAAKLRTLAKTVMDLKVRTLSGKVAFLAKVQAVLTPAQWKQVRSARGHRGCPDCKGRRGRRGPHGPRKGDCGCVH